MSSIPVIARNNFGPRMAKLPSQFLFQLALSTVRARLPGAERWFTLVHGSVKYLSVVDGDDGCRNQEYRPGFFSYVSFRRRLEIGRQSATLALESV